MVQRDTSTACQITVAQTFARKTVRYPKTHSEELDTPGHLIPEKWVWIFMLEQRTKNSNKWMSVVVYDNTTTTAAIATTNNNNVNF